MKKLLSAVIVASAVVFANGALADWNLVASAQKVQDKADAAAKKIEEAKVRDAEKKAELKAKMEAKKAETQAKKAEREKALDDAKSSLNNLKNVYSK